MGADYKALGALSAPAAYDGTKNQSQRRQELLIKLYEKGLENLKD